MNELDIKQIQKILSISYPTALSYMHEHGKSNGKKWTVDASKVEARIAYQQEQLNGMKQALAECLMSSVIKVRGHGEGAALLTQRPPEREL
jgi:hypothetical protein